jgi:phosphatidylglycerol:prolipoprotein diacylglycerol transferase
LSLAKWRKGVVTPRFSQNASVRTAKIRNPHPACHPGPAPVICACVQSEAFSLGPLTIHWYGILVATGFLAGLWTASRRALRDNISPDVILDIGPWLILGTIVGARSLFVISYWSEKFAGKPWYEVFMIQKGGLVYYGGLVGASLTVLFYMLWKKLPIWRIGDVFAPSIALGSFFGRMGCLMNGCCYGRSCDLPWAIHFPADHHTKGVGVHPTQIYDSLLNLALYVALAWLFRHKKFHGQVFASFLIGYAALRALVESTRGDYPVYYLGGVVTPAQLISIAIFSVGVAIYAVLRRRPVAPSSS